MERDCNGVNSDNPTNDVSVSGWRYCTNISSLHVSAIVRSHHGIVAHFSQYYTGDDLQDEENFGTNDPTDDDYVQNSVIPLEQHGEMVAVFSQDGFRDVINIQNGLNMNLFGLRELGTIDNPNLEKRQTLFDALYALNPILIDGSNGLEKVKIGDYVYVERAKNGNRKPRRHGFVVAGWGPLTSCESALTTFWHVNEPGATQSTLLYRSLSDVPATLSGAIPYVVDFTGILGEYDIDANGQLSDDPDGQDQYPRPRPIYCTQYNYTMIDGEPSYLQEYRDGFAFYSFPDSVSLPADRLYSSEQWQW
ncbi:MAG: hypothetical protein ACPG5P_03290 [Saprospiraceae bacterium]